MHPHPEPSCVVSGFSQSHNGCLHSQERILSIARHPQYQCLVAPGGGPGFVFRTLEVVLHVTGVILGIEVAHD